MKPSSLAVGLLLAAGLAAAGRLEAQTGFCAVDCLKSYISCLGEERCRVLGGCAADDECVNNRCRNSNEPCGRIPAECGVTCDLGRGACLDGCGPTYFFGDLLNATVGGVDERVRRPLLTQVAAAEKALQELIGEAGQRVVQPLEAYRKEVDRLRVAGKLDAGTARFLAELTRGVESGLGGEALRQCVARLAAPELQAQPVPE